MNRINTIYRYNIEKKEVFSYEFSSQYYFRQIIETYDGEIIELFTGPSDTPIMRYDRERDCFVEVKLINRNGVTLQNAATGFVVNNKLINYSNEELALLYQNNIFAINLAKGIYEKILNINENESIFQISKDPKSNSLWIFILQSNYYLNINLYKNFKFRMENFYRSCIFWILCK